MADKKADILKQLDEVKQKTNDPKLKQAIEDKQKSVKEPINKN